MAYDKDVSKSFTPVTLAAAEVWQCREGSILVTEGTVTDNNQGIVLQAGDGLRIASGKVVNYRTLSDQKAILAREEFE